MNNKQGLTFALLTGSMPVHIPTLTARLRINVPHAEKQINDIYQVKNGYEEMTYRSFLEFSTPLESKK